MCAEIKKFISENKDSQYHITIGSDSQEHVSSYKYVTAIMVHRVGKGAQYYWRTEEVQNVNSLRQKIMYEASLTYQFKEMLKEKLENLLIENNIYIEPHVDIGHNGKTRQFINEIITMFKGYGEEEEVKIKPFSTAASSVANKHTK